MWTELKPAKPAKFSVTPLYEQVKDTLAQQIASGAWQPNVAIPPESELARELGVSPGTMRKALDLLEAEGLIIRRQGRGTFVTDPTSPQVACRYTAYRNARGERIIGDIKLLGALVASPTPAEQLHLELTDGDQVYRIDRARSYNGRMFALESVAMPFELFPDLIERGLAGKNLTEIASKYGVLLGKAEATINAAFATPEVASAMGIPSGSAVMTLSRVLRTRDGRPLQYRFSHFHETGAVTVMVDLG